MTHPAATSTAAVAIEQPKAIIYVDGEEFMRVWGDSDDYAMFDETVRRVGGEVALMVWKPRYGIYIRERLSITGEVKN